MNSLPRLPAPPPAFAWRKRLEKIGALMPMVLLAVLLWGSVWLQRNAPQALTDKPFTKPSHEPDYFSQEFTLKTYSLQGELKSFLQGSASEHYPDTLTNYIEMPVVHTVSLSGRVSTAVAKQSLSNEDGSEIQLMGKAVLHKQGLLDQDPDMTLRSEFIHLYANTDRVVTYAPVKIERGDNRFEGQNLQADNLNQHFVLQGQVKALLVPAKQP
jgi:lipopolysaccharide export system protein LptC